MSKKDFIIQGEGMGLKWMSDKSAYKYILNSAFYDKTILYDTERSYSNPNLVIRCTHPKQLGKDNDPYFEYFCPYICRSGDPYRCNLRTDRLPIYEFNVYIKDDTTTKKKCKTL
jgi:hypothetical protein